MSEIDQLVGALTTGRQIDLPIYLRAVEGGDSLRQELAAVQSDMEISTPLFVSGTSQSCAVCNDLAPERASRTTVADNSRSEVRRIADLVNENADAVIAVGGGRPIDVAKAAALLVDVPVVVIPTQLSADGIASPIAVIREDGGDVVSERGQLPVAVVADLELLAGAPINFARAGVGDLLGNRTALEDWRIAAAAGQELVDDFAALLASCAHLLIEGLDLSPLARGEMTIDLARRLLDGLVLSGLAMEIAGSSRPCSGSEHLISHALDALEPGTAAHGEQVAFGTLIATALQGGDPAEPRALMAAAGLNGALTGFGISPARMAEVIKFGPSTRPGRYTVLDRERPSLQSLRTLIEGLHSA